MCNLPLNPHIPGNCPTAKKMPNIEQLLLEFEKNKERIAVIGCGRVGAPLLTFLKSKGLDICGIDVDTNKHGPLKTALFKESNWQETLDKIWQTSSLYIYDYKRFKTPLETIIITCGTPLDNKLFPDSSQINGAIKSLIDGKLVDNNTLIILRSTLFVGGSKYVQHLFNCAGLNPDIAFAPERIMEGKALDELYELPQIISGITTQARMRANNFFQPIVKETVLVDSTEIAEMAKLFCNNYRYINFAIGNEFNMLCDSMNIDFESVRKAANHNYPRCNIPKAVLALNSPCTSKDWKILTYQHTESTLCEKAHEVAEKTITYYVNKYKDKIIDADVGILGLAFKPNSDNPTEALVTRLIEYLKHYGAKSIKVHDPYITHPLSDALDNILDNCSLIFVACEHDMYQKISLPIHTTVRL